MTTKGIGQSDPLAHLVSTYVARRELVRVLKRDLLHGETEIKLEEAELLLGFFRAKTGDSPVLSLDGKGFSGMRQIEAVQMLSQSQIHRRVAGLISRKYLEERLPRRRTSALKVRLTNRGQGFAEQYWKDYRTFASMVLEGVDTSQRAAHLRVNDAMQCQIYGLSLTRLTSSEKVDPVENLMSVFAAARAIRRAIEHAVVLPADGLSVERTDVLVLLYTRGGEFVPFGEIQRNLVQSFEPSRHLISKWISEMGADEIELVKTQPLPGKRMGAAITRKGLDVVKPILERYTNLEANLLADIPEEDLQAHLRINYRIRDCIRPRPEDLIAPSDANAAGRAMSPQGRKKPWATPAVSGQGHLVPPPQGEL
jgi:hypothetical protein